MFNLETFSKCIRENLKDRRYGKERADEIIADFESRAKVYESSGHNQSDAAMMAMRDTFDNMSNVAAEKAKRTVAMLRKQAENQNLIESGKKVELKLLDAGRAEGEKKTSRGKAVARAAVSLIEDDPRYNSIAYTTTKDVVTKQLFSLMGDNLVRLSKGAFGRQRGKMHLPNTIREAFGEATGDKVAKDFMDSYLKTNEFAVDLFNEAGGSMRKLQRYVPQPNKSIAKLFRNAEAWKATRAERWDWNKMRWPDGSPIDVKDRAELIDGLFDTFTTDGAVNIDAKAFRGKGAALGNALDNNRFIHYKDADSWLKDLEEFGDGTEFDSLIGHIDHMGHKVALLQTFGPNPQATVANLEAMIKKATADLSPKDKLDADEVIKNKLRPMMDVITRKNPMSSESIMGNTVVGVSNVLTAAQLGSASFLAIPGDFMQTVAVRALNKMDLFGGMKHYFDAILLDPEFAKQISNQSGFIHDDMVMSNYAATRFSGLATLGPAVTKKISDGVMRASVLSGHTKSARWAAQAEFMGLLHRSKMTGFNDLPFKRVMERYGITASDWAHMSAIKAYSPKEGVDFLRPIDILQTDIKNKQQLFQKFQSMILEESRKMVPESTIEGTVTLKNTTRPDTLAGMILHSFAMYKNFPISFYNVYGRLAMTSPRVKGRLGFIAGMGAGMTMVGALGTQMREVANGRDPMDMSKPEFWGKAFLSGGALAIWGDFLFSGVNRQNGGPVETAAGPLLGFMGDTTQLLFGDAFKWANTVGSLDEKEFKSNTGGKLVEYFKRYTPGTSIWWARAALERQVWDRFAELADPKVYQKRRRKEQNQEKLYGNKYWWPAGSRTPERAPQYGGQ